MSFMIVESGVWGIGVDNNWNTIKITAGKTVGYNYWSTINLVHEEAPDLEVWSKTDYPDMPNPVVFSQITS